MRSLPREGLEECRLNAKTMLQLGKEVTKFRAQFEKLAERLAKEGQREENDIKRQGKRKSFYDVQQLAKQVRKRG